VRFVPKAPSGAVPVGSAAYEVKTVGARVTQFALRAPGNQQVRTAWSSVQKAAAVAVPDGAEVIYEAEVQDLPAKPHTCRAVLKFFYLPRGWTPPSP
jgi:hypothetical protein